MSAAVPRACEASACSSAAQSSALLDPQLPLSAALNRFALAHEKMGNARLAQDQVAIAKFVTPLVEYLDGVVGEAMVGCVGYVGCVGNSHRQGLLFLCLACSLICMD